jgi:CRP-like cAMP-binding protein
MRSPRGAEALEHLLGSPFLEGFDPHDLAELARRATVVGFEESEPVFTQGNPATCLYLLVAGAVELSVEGKGGGPATVVQTVTHEGHPIGWSAMVAPHLYRATATAREPTRLVAVGREALEHQARANPGFGMALMRAVVGIVGDRLRATRTRLIARRYDDVLVAIRDLLDQSGPQLSVASPLHRLPYHLEHRLTLADAFHTLDALRRHGEPIERDLAALCADLLARARRELEFYQQLQAIYQSVAAADPTAGPEQVRLQSTLALRRLFVGTSHRIEGWEHLPERPGHIFIMNHLGYHPDNVLPNNFVLTLDTHFVSSMVLFERYGGAPIRVVRKSRPDEYGHQLFYDRLATSTPTPATSTPATRTHTAPPRPAAASSSTWPAPTSSGAGTWSSARRGPGPPPSSPRCGSDPAPSASPPTSAPSRCWCPSRWPTSTRS